MTGQDTIDEARQGSLPGIVRLTDQGGGTAMTDKQLPNADAGRLDRGVGRPVPEREGGYVPGACAAKIRARGFDFSAPRRPRLVTLEDAVRAVVEKHGGVRAAERATGVDKSFISRLMRGEKVSPSAETLEKLGLRAVPLYEVLKTANAEVTGRPPT
jgi:hypothetical protein